MSDLRDDFKRMIDGFGHLSLIAQLKNKVSEAANVGRRECGNCYFWMKSRECPREWNDKGRQKGPSCSELACEKFQIKDWVVELKAQRVAEAIAFAEEHDLPIPAAVLGRANNDNRRNVQ